jgi:nitrate/nitrite-specific signal transduction histidine kinase
MRVSSVTTAVCIALLSAGWAGWCWFQAEALRWEASGLMERGQAQASGYVHTFDDTLATQELETFAERRTVLERAHQWQRGQYLGVLVAVVAAACAWLLSVLRRLSGQLEEVSRELEPEPVPLRAVVRPSRS